MIKSIIGKYVIYIFCSFLLLSGCQSTTSLTDGITSYVSNEMLESLKLEVDKILSQELPLSFKEQDAVVDLSQFGRVKFDAGVKAVIYNYDSEGNLLLPPGDYSIPVMTYCMNVNLASPPRQKFKLNLLKGARARLIAEINNKASPQFSFKQIQMLSWEIQAGLSYQELRDDSKSIIDYVFQSTPAELNESVYSKIKYKWSSISGRSGGLIPDFENARNDFLGRLGDIGDEIQKIKSLHQLVGNTTNTFETLSQLIDTSATTKKSSSGEPQWVQISPNIFGRLLLSGHFQQMGILQVRVVSGQKRSVNSKISEFYKLNIGSLLATPELSGIQNLSFSPIISMGGIAVLPALIEPPIVAAFIVAAVLSSQNINWNKYFEILENSSISKRGEMAPLISNGDKLLSKAHDQLEKPAKDAGIISGKTKDSSNNPKGKVRDYTKSGGEKQWHSDFDKIEGDASKSQDGLDVKTTKDGTKIVKRPADGKKPSVIEIQSSSSAQTGVRVKIRYPE